MGEGGLEPPRPFGHRNLNPARLPIPPLARVRVPILYQHRWPWTIGEPLEGPVQGTLRVVMGLQHLERRLERMVEGVFARAFRGTLQPVEIGRRLTREMDLKRTMAPKGTLAPNEFVVWISDPDRERFAAIEDELVDELVLLAKEHAQVERYSFLGPVSAVMETDDSFPAGKVMVSADFTPGDDPDRARLVLPDGRTVNVGASPLTIGRLPDCAVVLSDSNVSRYHAEIRPAAPGAASRSRLATPTLYEVADLGSTNGTRVNGMLITVPRLLDDGDRITVGATTLVFEAG